MRVCTVCTHPHSQDIDAALVAGEPNRRIAARYGVSETAVRRHKQNHLPAALVVAHQADAVSMAGDLLAEVQRIHTSTLEVLRKSEAAADHRTTLLAVRECRGNIELLARLVTAAISAEREREERNPYADLSDEELDRQIAELIARERADAVAAERAHDVSNLSDKELNDEAYRIAAKYAARAGWTPPADAAAEADEG